MGRGTVPRTFFAIALLLAMLATACSSLETRIAEPRGGSLLGDGDLEKMEAALGIERSALQLPDGPRLVYRSVEPRAYGARFQFSRSEDEVRFRFNLDKPPGERVPVTAIGTVVMLHGWGMDGTSMLPWALSLAERGWRAVLVDLRNHGASGRAPASYGPREGQDVAALVTALREAGGIEGPVALFGVSFGAVAALYAGAELGPGNVDAVVAMAPYANAADGIRGMIEGMKSMPGDGLRSRVTLGYARMRYDDTRVNEAIRSAGERLGIDLSAVDVRQAAAAVPACVLLLHGTEDGFFAMEDVQSLADAAPRGQLVPLEGEHHFSAPMRMGWLGPPLADWLQGAAAGGNCPALVLPPPPDVQGPDAT